MADLFSTPSYEPLAARMRPRNLSDYIGQEHILAPGKALRSAVEEGHATLHGVMGAARRW